jgi:hypothetical protein
MTLLMTTICWPRAPDRAKSSEIGMGGTREPPSALASAAALVNNYANGIGISGLLHRNCITIINLNG